MLRVALPLVVLLIGCQVPKTHMIPWEPRDQDLVARQKNKLRKEQENHPAYASLSLEEGIEFDPLSVVSNERIRSIFRQISETDERIYHCQMGSTEGYVTTLEFTPRRLSATTVERKMLICQRSDKALASSCRFEPWVAYYLDDPHQYYEVDDGIDPDRAREVMSLLVSGSFQISAYGFPLREWPEDWYKHSTGWRLGALKPDELTHASFGILVRDHHEAFELTFPGCGCWVKALVELAEGDRALRIVSYWSECV